MIKSLITRRFPAVKWITTKELAEWLENPIKPQPILLDARSQAEYTLSHLKFASRIEPHYPDLDAIAASQDTPVVVYCSVGYRSAAVAQQLEQEGFERVYNLEGSIFQWANEDRLLYNSNNPTLLVHPYNRRWGKLLKSRSRANIS